eukprot:c24437_g1_i1 orf=123-1817(-)
MGSCTRMSSSTLLTNALILLVYCVLYLSSNIGFINAAPARHLLNDQPSVDKPSVIIIGAGMSGIMAAKSLAKHGVEDFIILEATEKIGGRMRKTDFAGVSVELGANWVEGVAGKEVNPIWRLAKEFNLRTFYSDYDNITSNFYSQEGTLLPLSTVKPQFDLSQAAVEFTNKLSESLNANKEEDISILTSQRMFGKVPTSPLDMAIDYYNYDYEAAEPPRITSLKNVLPRPTFHDYGEDLYLVADSRGYVHVVHQLAKTFLKYDGENLTDTRVKLNKVVNHIEYTSTGVTVKTEDGSTYDASYAILSVSLGVLQSNLITYKPDLPYWKLKTFFTFDMAVYTKIFIKFPYTFWPTGPGTDFFIYVDEKRGYYPIWQQLNPQYPGSNVLFVTVTDDESRRIEQQPDEETKQEIMVVLRKMFGPTIPEIQDIIVPRWWNNRFFKGTFTNWPIGASEPDFDRMKAPIGGRLYFTGEHTSEKFNGYVHGAYLAGIDTAKTLLDCMKYKKCAEITPDGLPLQNVKAKTSADTDSCEGSCCAERQQEREAVRQSYVHGIQSLQEALEKKCTP